MFFNLFFVIVKQQSITQSRMLRCHNYTLIFIVEEQLPAIQKPLVGSRLITNCSLLAVYLFWTVSAGVPIWNDVTTYVSHWTWFPCDDIAVRRLVVIATPAGEDDSSGPLSPELDQWASSKHNMTYRRHIESIILQSASVATRTGVKWMRNCARQRKRQRWATS